MSEDGTQDEREQERRARIVLSALRGAEHDAFEQLLESVEPATLDQLAASEHGAAWAAVPFHLVPDDVRLRLLQAAARMHRYDGNALHLDVTLFELFVRTLDEHAPDWAEVAARSWLQLVLHVGEGPGSWPQARSLVDRYPDQLAERPALLGTIAMIGSCCGAPEAAGLWQQVLAHPRLGDSAERRLTLELDWARSHLLYDGDEMRRGIAVLERVRRGFAELGTPIADLHWTDATMDLLVVLTWSGRIVEARRLADESLRRVEPGSEIELWIRAVAGYAAAHVGDDDAVLAGIDSAERAATDTTMLFLRTVVPMRMVVAARTGDRSAMDDAIDEARALEQTRQMHPEMRSAWRVHAAEILAAWGQRDRAIELLDEVATELDAAAHDLPVHRLRHDNLRRVVDPEAAPDESDISTRARRLGVDLSVATLAEPLRASCPRLVVRLMGRFVVECDESPLPIELWDGRRQARLLLALLLVEGGTVTLDHVAETLWDAIDPVVARNRIKPLCNTIRSVLAAPGGSTPPRELLVRGGSITLVLHPDDRCDLGELRDIRDLVRTQPARARELALAALGRLDERPLADLGSDAAASMLRDEIEREVLELVPEVAAAWDGVPAPAPVVAAVARAHAIDPTSASTCARLISLYADLGDAPSATAAFHVTREALRTQLGMSVPADLARLHADVLAAHAPTAS